MISQPLYSLLKKDILFEFGQAERHLNAFEMLKTKLVKSPILAVYEKRTKRTLSYIVTQAPKDLGLS